MTKWMLVAAALLSAAASSEAYLCSADRVPAATLLFPFVRGTFAAGATATEPAADRTKPHTVFSVTNVSHRPKIVNVVLHNDFGDPLFSWNALLTGYDVAAWDFADVMEGKIRATGPATDPSTGRPFSPLGGAPGALGPVPAFYPGLPELPAPSSVGTTPNGTASLYGLCTNPVYTAPPALDPGIYRFGIPRHSRARIFAGLRQSQRMAASGWFGTYPPSFSPPAWLLERDESQEVWGFVTVDVVDACSEATPESGASYFQSIAKPVRTAPYGGNPASGYTVAMGNTLLGDFREVSDPVRLGPAGTAVSIEVDAQDVANATDLPRQVLPGASFYRYVNPGCGDAGRPGMLPQCEEIGGLALMPHAADNVRVSAYSFGPAHAIPSGDFREPLPSAFGFRWHSDESRSLSTHLRVWKEFPDTYLFEGTTYVESQRAYSYYAWDEEEHVLATPAVDANQFPLMVQEVDVSELPLPTTYLKAGWMVVAFFGSAGPVVAVPGGYSSPAPHTYGTQAWIDVRSASGGSDSLAPAHVFGNFLCDAHAVAGTPATENRLDLGNLLY
jgi:hypothetical protein